MREDAQELIQLFQQPFFTLKEIRQLGITPSLISYYEKKGRVEKLERGIYKGTTVENDQFPFPYEDLFYAVSSIKNGVICLISALSIYELTEQIQRQYWIAVPNSNWASIRKGFKIIRMRNMTLGKTFLTYGNTKIPIFDKERTVIDSIKILDRETGLKALKIYLEPGEEHKPDIKKLLHYAKERGIYEPVFNYIEILSV